MKTKKIFITGEVYESTMAHVYVTGKEGVPTSFVHFYVATHYIERKLVPNIFTSGLAVLNVALRYHLSAV